MKYKIGYAEDESDAREKIHRYIEKDHELKEIWSADSGKETLQKIEKEIPNILILDIELPQVNGLEIAKLVRNKDCYLIFSTAYSKYAVQAFEVEANDYLLKPLTLEKFQGAIKKAKSKILEKNSKTEKEQTFSFLFNSKNIILKISEIIYLSGEGRFTIIHTEEKDYQVSRLLKDVMEELPQEYFMRIHKKFIVNKDKIRSMEYEKGGTYSVVLKNTDDTTIPVGRKFASELRKSLGIS